MLGGNRFEQEHVDMINDAINKAASKSEWFFWLVNDNEAAARSILENKILMSLCQVTI